MMEKHREEGDRDRCRSGMFNAGLGIWAPGLAFRRVLVVSSIID